MTYFMEVERTQGNVYGPLKESIPLENDKKFRLI